LTGAAATPILPHPEPATMRDFPNLTVLEHPLIQHKLAVLRDRKTSKKTFRALVDEISMLMGYEVTSDLPLQDVRIETPLEAMSARMVSGKKLTLVPILRAGLGMVEGMLRLMPSVRVGHIGLYRDHETLQPVSYYFKIPPEPEARDFIVLDPMLATGGSAAAAVQLLKQSGAVRVRLVCLVAAPEGVERMADKHADVQIYTAALDRQLDERGFILPGLGDAGDRLFGTR
jgi:uracil phosphoribosyltransferase